MGEVWTFSGTKLYKDLKNKNNILKHKKRNSYGNQDQPEAFLKLILPNLQQFDHQHEQSPK